MVTFVHVSGDVLAVPDAAVSHPSAQRGIRAPQGQALCCFCIVRGSESEPCAKGDMFVAF